MFQSELDLIPPDPGVKRTTTPSVRPIKNSGEFLYRHVRKSEDVFALSDPKTTTVESLDSLRCNAVAKEFQETQAANERKLGDAKMKHKLFMKNLVGICDATRAVFVSSGKATMRAASCFKQLAQTKRCNVASIKLAIQYLATHVVPEFVSIVPADKLLPYETVKINEQCSYRDVRAKVVLFVSKVN